MKTIYREIVSAMIFSKDGKLFQGKKDPKGGGVYSDCWHLPGGGVKENEDREQALVREIKEETGIDISKYPVEFADDAGTGESEKVDEDTGGKVLCKMRFSVYKVVISDKTADEIEVKLGSDLETFRWIRPKDIRKKEITPPSRELFARLSFL